ncbi:AmmeMemoRadiSam system protein B [Candidatus Woesearchaeota archaeon]|jgi:MEMO1 family protein|nr:AmmeMemoRadiSam system protein B [Candidatus Woesearchaeota archaeon]
MKIRQPAVSGQFYPETKEECEELLAKFLNNVQENEKFSEYKKAFLESKNKIHGIVVPHAGWEYSGEIAAYGYDLIKEYMAKTGKIFNKIILIGPNHTIPTNKAVTDDNDSWQTPLGEVKLMKPNFENPNFVYDSAPHLEEHNLEVQVPFLQHIFNELGHEFEILPIILGEVNMDDFDKILAQLLKLYDEDTLFIFSTDLSHFKPLDDARKVDGTSIQIIQNLDFPNAQKIDACGKIPLMMMMLMCNQLKIKPTVLKYSTSAEKGGDYNSVVGYVSMMF